MKGILFYKLQKWGLKSSFLMNIGFLLWLSLNFITNETNFHLTLYEIGILSFINVGLMVTSLIVHEIGHRIGSIISEIRINKIILSCIGGIIFFNDEEKIVNIKKIIVVFFSGPITNISIGLLLLLFWSYYSNDLTGIFPIKDSLENSLGMVSLYNIIIGSINLIPILPFDGGKIIYYLLFTNIKKK